MANGWTPDKFNRRRYVVEGSDLDKARKIQVLVKVDGKVLVDMHLREPGILAIISRPQDQGFDVEIVEPTGKRFTDNAIPADSSDEVAAWQLEALGF